MTTRVMWLAMAAAAVALVVGFETGQASAAVNGAPVVSSGSMTVRYDEIYSIHFTASDPDGDPLTVVAQPTNEDWLSCDGGPATDFTCEYSSSRYYDPAPLPTAAFERTVSYTVSDGTTTSTGVWTITVEPPPTMQITGNPTVTEGGDAVVKLELSSNVYGSLMVLAHAVELGAGGATLFADLVIPVADGQTTADVHIPIADDAIAGPTRHFSLVVDQVDAIPYRFVPGGNVVTVLDNDGSPPSDTTPPVVGAHRNMIVERGDKIAPQVFFTPPLATDDVDGVVPVTCVPASMSAMPIGRMTVSCSATDKAGNMATSSFDVIVRRPTSPGVARVIGGFDDDECAAPGQVVWVAAEGFTPGANVVIQLQASDQQMIPLQTAQADRRGRVRQIFAMPTAATGDADVVVTGAAGPNDLVRMVPLRVSHGRHRHGGGLVALLRHLACD
jgi:hypothetical protein